MIFSLNITCGSTGILLRLTLFFISSLDCTRVKWSRNVRCKSFACNSVYSVLSILKFLFIKMSTTEENTVIKRSWKASETNKLISEFKKHYELWKQGEINKKKDMWQHIAKSLTEFGHICTAEQAENRFKTLQRSTRKSFGYVPKSRKRKEQEFYNKELTAILAEHGSLIYSGDEIKDDDDGIQIFYEDFSHENQGIMDIENTVCTEKYDASVALNPKLLSLPRSRKTKQRNKQKLIHLITANEEYISEPGEQILDEETGTFKISQANHADELSEVSYIINEDNENNSNEVVSSKKKSSITRSKNNRTKKMSVKTSTEVLLEIKELIKKIEIRKQMRHEQNLKIATDRNKILRKKNHLLEQILLKL